MIDRALAAVGYEPDVSTWLFQAVRELNGLKPAMTDVRDELANNLAKLSAKDRHLAQERRKLTEKNDPELQQMIREQISNLEAARQGQLEALSANRAALRSQVSQIRETFRRLLHEDATLRERLRTLFREQGITIASILTALGMTISTIVLAITGGGASGAPSLAPKPSGGVKEWVKKHLQALGRVLAKLAGKAAAALPGIIGLVVSWLLSTLGKTTLWLAENLWAAAVLAVGLIIAAIRG